MDQAQDLLSPGVPPYQVDTIVGMSGMYNSFDSVEALVRRGLLTKDHSTSDGYMIRARPGIPCAYKPGMCTKMYEILDRHTMICVSTISITLWRCSSGATVRCINNVEHPRLLDMIARTHHLCPELVPLLWSFIEAKLI